MASLDHALWFHRPFRADEWLLYSIDSPSAQGGRGLARGLIYDRSGKLVASTAQEGLIRVVTETGVADAQATAHVPAKA
jgi:acyl-CoA thioesterase-2